MNLEQVQTCETRIENLKLKQRELESKIATLDQQNIYLRESIKQKESELNEISE